MADAIFRAEMRRARLPAWRAWLMWVVVRLVGAAAFRGGGRDKVVGAGMVVDKAAMSVLITGPIASPREDPDHRCASTFSTMTYPLS